VVEKEKEMKRLEMKVRGKKESRRGKRRRT
jgi:hypothetical protein